MLDYIAKKGYFIGMQPAMAHVIISGLVQGVLFRSRTQEMALMLGVKGWVRNKPDGTVEAVFEGEKDLVEGMIKWCHKGPPHAEVSNVSVDWKDYTGKFTDFNILFGDEPI